MKNFGPENFFPIANAGQIIAKTLAKRSQCPPSVPLYTAQRHPC